ncbi:STAS domain-containing protein [Paractinoplanes atraurantiacus]|uniref:Anti-sigma factor antagonist n=1 Tax=Paractinoplanes atraurantiacus TaxID=1036182 RepID=A0A285JVA0_9ACTN|nr:STAS domain-containing protein [Actinoplanes atraurantiacus]SNY64239.1 anti-sigma B factor antagonist [Actinoplanes atraurantiacus]
MRAVSVGADGDGTLVVVLRGELDYTNSRDVATVIREAVAERRPPAVRVDLAEVGFLDSSGIGVLVQALQAAEDVPAGFRVQNPRDKVLDQLRISGLLELFGLVDAAAGPGAAS